MNKRAPATRIFCRCSALQKELLEYFGNTFQEDMYRREIANKPKDGKVLEVLRSHPRCDVPSWFVYNVILLFYKQRYVHVESDSFCTAQTGYATG